MDLYHIPGDSGKPYRRKLIQQLLRFAYVDGATDYCLLVPYAKAKKLAKDERVWLAYLYGLSYSCTTAIRIFEAFPEVSHIRLKEMHKFWASEKDTLWFNPDKKYIKNNDQVIPAIKSIKSILNEHASLLDWVSSRSEQGTNFSGLYRGILDNWDFFGPHGAYLFFDALYGLCPDVYVDPEHLDWKHSGKTVVEGMAHMLYQDELIETREFPLEKYDHIVDKLQEASNQPKVIIESTLCAFRKFFKGTRYLGYYADRMLEECHFVSGLNESYVPDIWEFRRKTIPRELRGEDCGWKGIRKDRMRNWLEKGEL